MEQTTTTKRRNGNGAPLPASIEADDEDAQVPQSRLDIVDTMIAAKTLERDTLRAEQREAHGKMPRDGSEPPSILRVIREKDRQAELLTREICQLREERRCLHAAGAASRRAATAPERHAALRAVLETYRILRAQRDRAQHMLEHVGPSGQLRAIPESDIERVVASLLRSENAL